MKIRFLKFYNKLISYLIAFLGIGIAFSANSCMYGTPAEYGTPNATFKVLGKVTNVENIALPNIRVIMQYDTTYSDLQGNYLVKTVSFPDDQSFVIRFSDLDGPANGGYMQLDTIVVFADPLFTGGTGHWNYGETEIEFNVKLKSTE